MHGIKIAVLVYRHISVARMSVDHPVFFIERHLIDLRVKEAHH